MVGDRIIFRSQDGVNNLLFCTMTHLVDKGHMEETIIGMMETTSLQSFPAI